jgi:hypothetical protein
MESPIKRPGYPFEVSKKDKEAIKKEITKPKPKPTPKLKTWGAGDPNYIKDMIEMGKTARKARENAKQGIYVNPTYGPIAGSAE